MSTTHGCLAPYAKLASSLHPQLLAELSQYANATKGFLCNFQIPLMYVFAVMARGQMAEIGCWYGRTSRVLLIGAGPDLTLHCVDTFMGSEEHQSELKGYCFKQDFEANLAPFEGRYRIVQAMSHEAASSFQDGQLDYVWIDASHDYENVKRDVASWLPKLKAGGIMLGHDYPEPGDPNGGFEELSRAVNESVRDSAAFTDFGWVCGIWGARKAEVAA